MIAVAIDLKQENMVLGVAPGYFQHDCPCTLYCIYIEFQNPRLLDGEV